MAVRHRGWTISTGPLRKERLAMLGISKISRTKDSETPGQYSRKQARRGRNFVFLPQLTFIAVNFLWRVQPYGRKSAPPDTTIESGEVLKAKVPSITLEYRCGRVRQLSHPAVLDYLYMIYETVLDYLCMIYETNQMAQTCTRKVESIKGRDSTAAQEDGHVSPRTALYTAAAPPPWPAHLPPLERCRRRCGRHSRETFHWPCATTRGHEGEQNKTLLKGFVRLRGTCSPLRSTPPHVILMH